MDQTTPPTSKPPVSWEPPAPPRSDGGFSVSDFFSFRYLITPTFIRVIYVIGVILITIGAVGYMQIPSAAGGGLISAAVLVVLGNLWWRIVLELVMVLFRINDSLGAIERRGRGL